MRLRAYVTEQLIIETYTDFEKDWKASFIAATEHFIEVVKGNGNLVLSSQQAKHILKFNLAAIKSADLSKEIYLKDVK